MKPDFDAIRARCEAATPGPWHVEGDPSWWRVYSTSSDAKVFDDGSAGEEYAQVINLEDRDFLVAARTDIPALLAYVEELERRTTYTIGETEWAQRIATLEHMLSEERENVDTLRREIDKAQAAFDYGCGQDGPDGWKPGETVIDALVRAKHERDELRTTVEELKARIVVLEAMKP